MDEEEAMALVQRLIGPEKFDREQARRLARSVGLHPLAISIATLLANEGRLDSTLREIADEQKGLSTLVVGPEETVEPSALPRSVRAVFNVAYRHLDPAVQKHLRLLAVVPDRLPYVDRMLMGVLMKQRDTVAAHNALRRLAEFGIVDPVEAKSLVDKWGVWQLKPQAESDPVYRVNLLWLRFAREKAAKSGPRLTAVMWRIACSPIGARQGPLFRPVLKLPPGKKVGWELGQIFMVKRMVQEVERTLYLHGLVLDPQLRPLVYRILYRDWLLAGIPGILLAFLPLLVLMSVGFGLFLVLNGIHAPPWLARSSGMLLILIGAASPLGVSCIQLVTKIETLRMLWWLYQVLLPLSLMGPDARAERLKELGITGDMWSAMVRKDDRQAHEPGDGETVPNLAANCRSNLPGPPTGVY